MPRGDRARSGRLVQVLAATSIPEGLLARSLLESEGIAVFVKGESEGPYRMGPMYLWVPEELEVQARLVLAEAIASARTAGRGRDGEPESEGGGPGTGRSGR